MFLIDVLRSSLSRDSRRANHADEPLAHRPEQKPNLLRSWALQCAADLVHRFIEILTNRSHLADIVTDGRIPEAAGVPHSPVEDPAAHRFAGRFRTPSVCAQAPQRLRACTMVK